MPIPAHALAAARAVDSARLWGRIHTMAAIGATPKGGVNRQAFSAEDAAARALLAGWAGELGLQVAQDAIGNLYVRRPGTEPGLAPVLTGSHLDSQPTGGKFDGAYGVLAGFEVLEALARANIAHRRPIEVVAWSNEEGSSFQPGAMGSAVFSGDMALDALMDVRNFDGAVLRECLERVLAACPDVALRAVPEHPSAYVEAHIEQGPRLEKAGLPIGVVSGIQGQHRYRIEIAGDEAHAGTTPHALRKDALQAAIRVVQALNAVMADPDDVVRFTIGRFEVRPGSPNTVPGQVMFTIDLRHPDAATIARLGAAVEPTAKRAAGPCAVEVTRSSVVEPVIFDPGIIDTIAAAGGALDLAHMHMISGAGHDAMHVAHVAPAGMVFIPCERGVSHNEAEAATEADCARGARVLAASLVALAER